MTGSHSPSRSGSPAGTDQAGFAQCDVPGERLAREAWAAAQRFSRRSAPAFSQAKHLLAESSTNGYVEHLRAEAEAIHACAASPDSAEGIQAFLDKRDADFTGPYLSVGEFVPAR